MPVQVTPYITPPKKDKGFAKAMPLVGAIAGAAVGTAIAPGAGTLAGMNAGMGLGGMAGAMTQKPPDQGAASPTASTDSDTAMQRRMAAKAESPFTQLRNATISTAALPPDLRQEALPPLFEAMKMESQGRRNA